MTRGPQGARPVGRWARKIRSPEPEELTGIVEEGISTMAGDHSAPQLALFRELEELAIDIRRARSDIAQVRPDEINSQFIPFANDELDAIVAATEQATNAIMTAAETIESLSNGAEPNASAQLVQAVTSIYEACSFQDITGQRVRKVVKTLKNIEGKVDAMLRTLGSAAPAAAPAMGEIRRNDESRLLEGPQLPGQGNSQDAIDQLLSNKR